jgi:excisionase family DNA binding protein
MAIQTVNNTELLTIKDLPFSRSTVWRMRRDGRLPSYKVGRRVYVRRSHFEGFLKSCERGTGESRERENRVA